MSGSETRIRCGTDTIRTHDQPVNKQAMKEVVGRWERSTSPICPNLCPVPVNEVQRRVTKPGLEPFRDLTGQRNGKMVIVGLITYRASRRSSWAARCDCGNYEQRNHRNWQKYLRKGVPDACRECVSLDERESLLSKFLGPKPPDRSKYRRNL